MTENTPDNKTEAALNTLFEYMGKMIYSPEKAELDVEALPPAFRNLGKGIVFYRDCILEQRNFTHELTAGNLRAKPPSAENPFAAGIKELQAALLHAVWQAQEVAKGDYAQSIDYMGEFGDAFNTMVVQLKDREEALERDKEAIEQAYREMESSNELMLDLALGSNRTMVFFDDETRSVMFESDRMREYASNYPKTTNQLYQVLMHCPTQVNTRTVLWEYDLPLCEDEVTAEAPTSLHFAITSRAITRNGRRMITHVLDDVTTEFRERAEMTARANQDPLTGLFNRRYGMERATAMLEEKKPFSLAFVDLDNLKYCNDNFGHAAGDDYLLAVSARLKNIGNNPIVCRVGGDEFMMLVPDMGVEELERELAEQRTDMRTDELPEGYEYYRSFSYGVIDMSPGEATQLSDALSKADYLMYKYKYANKKNLRISPK